MRGRGESRRRAAKPLRRRTPRLDARGNGVPGRGSCPGGCGTHLPDGLFALIVMAQRRVTACNGRCGSSRQLMRLKHATYHCGKVTLRIRCPRARAWTIQGGPPRSSKPWQRRRGTRGSADPSARAYAMSRSKIPGTGSPVRWRRWPRAVPRRASNWRSSASQRAPTFDRRSRALRCTRPRRSCCAPRAATACAYPPGAARRACRRAGT